MNTYQYDPAIVPEWDEEKWLEDFAGAKAAGTGFHILRSYVFHRTVEIVNCGCYKVKGRIVKLEDPSGLIQSTVYYDNPPESTNDSSGGPTVFEVWNEDCLETAEKLKQTGSNPAVLNMANRRNPGGGVLGGAGAQEENLFRRSNLFTSLYQYVDYSSDYGINRNNQYSYPLNRNTGGIYSPNVTIFRASESKGYALLKHPIRTSIITVPAISAPELEIRDDGKYYIIEELVEPTREKIRTILRIGLAHGHDSLVLGAFGCGAFRNPPHHVAQLFCEVFEEDEFRNKFAKIVFAILDDHNSRKEHNPEGNYEPFRKVINEFQKGRLNGF